MIGAKINTRVSRSMHADSNLPILLPIKHFSMLLQYAKGNFSTVKYTANFGTFIFTINFSFTLSQLDQLWFIEDLTRIDVRSVKSHYS